MLRVWLATSLLTWSFTFCVEDAQTFIFECIYLEYAYEVDILIYFFFERLHCTCVCFIAD